MTNEHRAGQRNEIYTDEAGDIRWRHFDSNGAEISANTEGLHPDHGEERSLRQVLDAYPEDPTWLERGPDLWVLLDDSEKAVMLRRLEGPDRS